jgi:uncharacterized membrane protein YkoI
MFTHERTFMTRTLWKTSVGLAALAACALIGAAVALGAGSTSKPPKTTTTGGNTAPRPARTPETPLTGDALAKVTAAAIAKVGGTVDFATTENDSSNAAAAYEAHVTKPDGTHVTVILDSSYAVLSVATGRAGGPGGHPGAPGGFPGVPGGPGNGETPLTGDIATKAIAAAVASAGGTAGFASTETDSTNTAAAYEVHVTKADGTHVVVILDTSFVVLATEADRGGPPGHGGRGPDGPPHGGHDH